MLLERCALKFRCLVFHIDVGECFCKYFQTKKRSCRDIEGLRSSLNTQRKLQRRKDVKYVEARTSETSKSWYFCSFGQGTPTCEDKPVMSMTVPKYQASSFSRCSELSDSQSCAAKIKATRNQAKYTTACGLSNGGPHQGDPNSVQF